MGRFIFTDARDCQWHTQLVWETANCVRACLIALLQSIAERDYAHDI